MSSGLHDRSVVSETAGTGSADAAAEMEISFAPLSLDVLWVLETCKHPLAGGPSDNAKAPTRCGDGGGDDLNASLTPLRLAQVAFCLAYPSEAVELLARAEPGALLSAFDKRALAWVREKVPLGRIGELARRVGEHLAAGAFQGRSDLSADGPPSPCGTLLETGEPAK